MTHDYNPQSLEQKWQKYWAEHKSFKTSDDFSKPKYYVLDMFPYPSGAGLHVGHPEGYTATDIVARYKRMNGFNVLHPMGWDAFGLPAERAAMRENIHPAEITKRNIATFKGQIQRLGLSYDWDRELSTTDAEYYRWTQWMFLKMYEKGLAYLAEVPVNWCPAQGTVLANEEVVDGKYVETGEPVERRVMKQWMLKITAYADALLDDLEGLDWPTSVIEMQRNWIGKSVGAKMDFPVAGTDHNFTIFTTRPDTIFGATYCVLAPGHDLLDKITTADQKDAVGSYCHKAANTSDRDREAAAGREKTGVFTGAYATNPVTGDKLPIWVADYVKLDYGSGAIMAVPAHDERDLEFAEVFDLPVIEVYDDNDKVINSDFLNGLTKDAAIDKIVAWLEEKNLGTKHITYKLRDWLFSRQRYWGEPFPIMFNSKGETVPVPEDSLPLTLPKLDEFKPTEDGRPPLGRATDWVETELDGEAMTRELNTMPQWAGSCWYYLRYMDPRNSEHAVAPEKEKYWGQVDLYVGGLEHAVLHLLYARFWHKVLYDCGVVSHKEPFKKLFNQGMILGISYRSAKGKYYHVSDVEEHEGKYYAKDTGEELSSFVEKMSKSKLNVVNPDDVVKEYGADSLRLYEMFMGPLEATKPWQTNGVKGVYNFLQKVWRQSVDMQTGDLNSQLVDKPASAASEALTKELNATIAKVTQDIESLKFNTAIARMMEFTNFCKNEAEIPQECWRQFTLLLAPFAPHLAEEVWQLLGATESLTYAAWPTYDPALLAAESIELVLCINGKKVSTVQTPADIAADEAEALLRADEKITSRLAGQEIMKTIYVPNKLVNAIVR